MDRLLTTDELAEVLKTSTHTVAYWRRIDYGPQGRKIGRRVLYRESEVQAFVAACFAEGGTGEGAA